MQGWTPSDIASAITAIGAVLTALLSPKIVEAMIKLMTFFREWRKEVRDRHIAQKALDEELNDKGYKYIIRRQDRQITDQTKRISVLEESLTERDIYYKSMIDDLKQEHQQCRDENRLLEARVAQLEHEHNE